MPNNYFADPGPRSTENDRLRRQGQYFEPMSRHLLRDAGLQPGMRVLDLGSGVGTLSWLAAEIVGETGSVVGVERDADAVSMARRGTLELGLSNVEFIHDDVTELSATPGGFDAVIGRFILMYLQDPAGALRAARRRLTPGGLICMQEPDLAYQWAVPMPPLWEQCRQWVLEALAAVGTDARMALSLPGAFGKAGLGDTQLRLDGVAAPLTEIPSANWADFVVGMVPLMDQLGIVSAEQIGADTLVDRMLAELRGHAGMHLTPIVIGAWARVPAED